MKALFRLPRAIFWTSRYLFPARKLNVIGVTGTDGKTTTVHLIHHLLKNSGKKASLVSSLGAIIADKEVETGLHVTTPDPSDIQRLLSQAVKAGSKYFVIEATSHGLAQHRLWGVPFTVGVVTNITHEHLDYHQTRQHYLEAKARLFRRAKYAVLNRDDDSFNYLKRTASGKITSYGIKKKADVMAEKIKSGSDGLSFILQVAKDLQKQGGRSFAVKSSLEGEFNVYNLLAAAAAGYALGLSSPQIKKGLESFVSVSGRMEEVAEGQDFTVVIDFAHTPNGLENALATLRKRLDHRGRLMAVFGSAGRRDRQKRPMMGEIAAKFADISILTAEDPRTEDVNQIIEEIAAGSRKGGAREHSQSASPSNLVTPAFFRIPDRTRAIEFSITKLARRGDVIGLFGKGHEASMAYGTVEKPWSEHEAAREALERLKNLKT